MTRYTELRHAGYYQPDLTDKERDKIAADVDKGTPAQTAATSSGSTTTANLGGLTGKANDS